MVRAGIKITKKNDYLNIEQYLNDYNIHNCTTSSIPIKISASSNNLYEDKYKVEEFNNVKTKPELMNIMYDFMLINHKNDKLRMGYFIDTKSESYKKLKSMRSKYSCGFCKALYNEYDWSVLNRPDGFDASGQENYAQYDDNRYWCTCCLSSPHLNFDDLKLLELKKMTVHNKKYDEPIPDKIEQMYKKAQGIGLDSNPNSSWRKKVANIIPDILKQNNERIINAITETNGYTILLNSGVLYKITDLDNVIYYHHDNRFGFGWKHPLDKVEYVELNLRLKNIKFPYDYVIRMR